MESFSGVPSSPDASLLLTKRRCPFGESPREMKIPACDLEHRIPGDNQSLGHARGALNYQGYGKTYSPDPSKNLLYVMSKQLNLKEK